MKRDLGNVFDRIITSVPVNAQAAKQLSRGETWTPTIKILDYFDDIPPVKPSSAYRDKGPTFVDFRGMAFDRLTVIGLMDKESDGPASWVCRCICGSYCTRKSRSLRIALERGNSFIGMCGMCSYQMKLRGGWSPEPKGVLRRG